MEKQNLKIDDIPCVLWGQKSDKLFIATHGSMSHKTDKVIEILAQEAEIKGYQTLSFDLPEHGDRKKESALCKVETCIVEFNKVFEKALDLSENISLFSCSISAYFSLMAFNNRAVKKALFLSPVLNMLEIIESMMNWFEVDEEKLRNEKEVPTPMGQTLYWDYYCYVKENPVEKWEVPTSILYGSKDELCSLAVAEDFCDKFKSKLDIFNGGEHYFHTDNQLQYYTDWLRNNI